jgi:carbon-monoxide dehydrogenase medium subunit
LKPPKFKYLRPGTLAEALEALRADDAKVIAGGQSLVPMLNFRLLRPSLLVDINRIKELDYLEPSPNGGLRIGALARHYKIETSALVKDRFPVLAAAAAHIGHLAIRNRGTIGGSLSHADPASEHLLISVLLDASLTIRSHRGSRNIKIGELIAGALSTTLEPQEILAGLELAPVASDAGWGFEEYARRSGDFAIASCAVVLERANERIAGARIAVGGGALGPARMRAAEKVLNGKTLDDGVLKLAAEAAQDEFQPNVDLHASADLRRHVLSSLLGRACRAAWHRTGAPVHG